MVLGGVREFNIGKIIISDKKSGNMPFFSLIMQLLRVSERRI